MDYNFCLIFITLIHGLIQKIRRSRLHRPILLSNNSKTLSTITRDSLRIFVEQDTRPQYIQTGNEITNGMLWPDGRLGPNNNWTQFIALLDTASQAVRTVLKYQTKIIIHITYPTAWSSAELFLDHVVENIDFDIIGLSYYPFWDVNFTRLRSCLEKISLNYDKQIFIVETNY